MKPALEALIKKAAVECVAAADDCLLTANAEKKAAAIITALIEKIVADATLTDK